MPINYDPETSRRNAQTRGLPFDAASGFDFETAVVRQDVRFAYLERRFHAIGMIGRRTVMLVDTPTSDGFRVISRRPASRKERRQRRESHP